MSSLPWVKMMFRRKGERREGGDSLDFSADGAVFFQFLCFPSSSFQKHFSDTFKLLTKCSRNLLDFGFSYFP